MSTMAMDPERYPLLVSGAQESMWTNGPVRFVFEPAAPILGLIGNVRCVAFSDEQILVIETAEFGPTAFPGGTLEPGEHWERALERELLEETGARPVSVEVVGRIRFRSGAERPFRSHLPHPEFHQVVAWADVQLVGQPTNPPGGEQVLSVELLPFDQAIRRVEGDPWSAELLRFVSDARRTGRQGLAEAVIG